MCWVLVLWGQCGLVFQEASLIGGIGPWDLCQTRPSSGNGLTLPGQLALRQVGKVGLTYSESRSGVWSATPIGTEAGGQRGQTP